AETYLQQLGLAMPNDATLFDRENRLWPRARDPEAAGVVSDRYIVFPHLEPFADPTRLSPAEISDSLYRTPVYLLLTEGPTAKFSLRLRYDASGGGDRSTLNLNALQIREGSEQLFVGGRKLERDVDYRISYEVGQVTFIDPDLLFGQGSAQITARFEERGIFAVAPTTILGMSTRYSLGERGAINLIGLYQREQSAFTRPALGFEATANLIGGINTELRFRPEGITRVLNSLTSSPTTAPSVFDVNAEFAFSKPDPNRSGEAYLEEFESEAGLQVPMREAQWEFGSTPESALGLEDIGFAAFDPADAVPLIWQNLVPQPGTNQPVELRPQDIDTLIRLAGRGEEPEPVLYTTLHADTAGGIVQVDNSSRWTQPRRDLAPRWRSMVTGLSTTGLDLTRNEFLEFWVFQPSGEPADSARLRLVIDLGTVSEDAVALAPDTMTVSGADTLFTGRQFVGTGELDTERSEVGIFNAQVDDIGILGDRPPIFEIPDGPIGELPICNRELGSLVPIFPGGDLSARCTRGNGVLDTEDLDGDQLLNAAGAGEDVFRYVVDLARGDFYVRDGVTSRDAQGRTATWRLYRIPLREPTQTINTPTLRLVKHMRITFATPPDAGQPDVIARLALARMRFLGSPWTRRSDTPILGLSGSAGEPHGEVSVSVISTENKVDLQYESPPGVGDQVARRGGDRETGGTQINERSLRILADDLRQGERAEAYLRFPAGPQNVLNYRTLRVWFRGRGPGWEENDLQAFLKLGSDDDNFYLYRTPARSTTWDPQAVIDLETWRRLRAVAENLWLSGAPPSGAAECGTPDPNAYVVCEGPYLVHLGDPGINPPNLASVQEVSAGIYRVESKLTVPTFELWVDDIRLSDPVSQTGTAASVDARLALSDVGNVNMAYTRQSGQFRQINEDPSYRASDALQVAGNLRLDRFLPTSFGLAIPLTVSYARLGVNPELLTGTDLRGDALPGLRKPESWSTNYALTIRRSRPGASWLTKGLLDPLSFNAAYTRGRSQTELSDARTNTYALGLNYQLVMRRRGFRLPLGGLAGILPGFIREGEVGKALQRADVSLVPQRVRLSSGLNRDEANSTAFRFPISRSDDRFLRPTQALTHLWRNSAGLTWQPLGMVNLSGDLTSTRDLRVYPDSTPIGRLAYNERRFLLGIPVGVERDRSLVTALAVTPALASWLRPRFISNSSFILSRTLTSRDPVRADVDSGAFILPKTLNNSRGNEMGVAVDLGQAFRQVAGDSGTLAKLLGRVRPVDLSTRLTRTSTYDLTAFEPSIRYMLGFGALNEFLGQEGTAALGVSESRVANLASGADLPLGFSFTLSHALTRTTRFQRVGDAFLPTETKQREWPVGNVRWSHTFRGGPFTLLAFGTSFRHREGNSVQGSRGATAGARSAIESSTITPDAQIGFRNGVSLTLGYSELDQSTLSNGNNTQLDQSDLSGSLNYAFRLPRSISRLRKQVRTSLTFISTDALTCLEQRGQEECIVISDVSRYELRGGLDTDLLQTVSAGLQVGYSLNDARHLSRRTSQISVLASFQLSLFAGD
ncbi:MAG: cell surface protein SprA, partial [Gemmatimonadales bacterium]